MPALLPRRPARRGIADVRRRVPVAVRGVGHDIRARRRVNCDSRILHATLLVGALGPEYDLVEGVLPKLCIFVEAGS